MKRKNKIIFMLIPFLFISCKNYFLNMDSVECYLNKNTYSKNEDIIITCSGDLSEYKELGGVGILFTLYKIKNGETDNENLPSYTFVDDGKLCNLDDCENGKFHAIIQQDSKMTNFLEKIKIRIDEPGEYRILLIVDCSCEKHKYTMKNFSYDFTVTE